MNLEQARFNMVEQQIRPWDVLDQRVLDLMSELPREQFVPEQYRRLAYSDTRIPLGHGEVMMSPKVEARMLQALDVGPEDSVLEIGTGSGFVTALLARSARHVHSVEVHEGFTALAGERIAQVGLSNTSLSTDDGVAGQPDQAPFDVIAVTGSLPILTEDLQRQLSIGGRLFAIVGDSPAMEARLITRLEDDKWSTEGLFETDLPPLTGAPTPDAFIF